MVTLQAGEKMREGPAEHGVGPEHDSQRQAGVAADHERVQPAKEGGGGVGSCLGWEFMVCFGVVADRFVTSKHIF